ncbi:hypothetical protein [Diaphorobacter sp. J5-51]|uniref:hypothetical protein n=1 Tax=Diaphorobacter sp. J5-51 TaxID=680496 RepID=UPI0012FC5AE5|nr:hypothetical protein [Diaphorobacter sp. J5-51]
MTNTMRVLAGEKRQRYFGQIRATGALSIHQLVRVIQSKDAYSVKLRAAALRNLVCTAPLEVTLGRTFCERRRLVRAHYGICLT